MEQKIDKSTPLSITALAVGDGFHRALETRYGYLFSNKELALIKHVINSAKDAYPTSTLNGLLIKSLSLLPYSMQQSFFNKMVVPSYDEVIMLRKLMIRHKIEEAIANNTTQIIILGGGYDIRALITAELHPDVMVYELDRGATRQNKLDCIKTIPTDLMSHKINEVSKQITQINHNLFYLDCDLTETSIKEILIPCGFKPEQKSFILAEGLSVYLNKETNQQLLATSHSLFQHEESELLIGYLEKEGYFSNVAANAHKESKEEYQFTLSSNEILPFIHASNLEVVAKKTPSYMLDDLNKKEDADFFRMSRAPQEHYFSIKKSSLNHYESLNAVPEMSIPIKKPEPQIEEQSSCTLM